MIALVIAALAQDPAPAGRWVVSPDSATLQTTSVEQRDVQMVARTPQDTFTKPRLILHCGQTSSVSIVGPRFPGGGQPFVYRIDREPAVTATARQTYMTIMLPQGVAEWIRAIAGRDWLQVRFMDLSGARDATFDLRAADEPLRAFAARCRADPDDVERALARRAGRAPGSQPVAPVAAERQSGRWRTRSMLDRFSDRPTVIASVSAVRSSDYTTPGYLLVRALDGRLEVYFSSLPPDQRFDVTYDSSTWKQLRGAAGSGGAFFLEQPQNVVRDLLAHRTLSIRGTNVEAVFDLAAADSALAPVLEAAGRSQP